MLFFDCSFNFRAEWDHFKETKWLMPLLSELSEWRGKMIEIEKRYLNENRDFDLTFVADFNGLKLENSISNYVNASIEVLNGEINVEFEYDVPNEDEHSINSSSIKIRKNRTLLVGERLDVSMIDVLFEFNIFQFFKMQVPSGAYHYVYTISEDPSCFFYIYSNQTAITVSKLYEKFSNNILKKFENKYFELTAQYFNESHNESSAFAAYNLTLLEYSKDFVNLISLNESNPTQSQDIHEIKYIENLIKKNDLRRVYDLFTEQVYNHISNEIDKKNNNFILRQFRELSGNFIRFKQR
jgi:hypothetical protein